MEIVEEPEKEAEALAYCQEQMRLMLSGEAAPYDAAWQIFGTALSTLPSPKLMHPLWLIWGSLTDWVENRPEETTAAEAAMLRAAQEWLSLPNIAAREAYFERWIYDELKYKRRGN